MDKDSKGSYVVLPLLVADNDGLVVFLLTMMFMMTASRALCLAYAYPLWLIVV
jgi:hypothetical protein